MVIKNMTHNVADGRYHFSETILTGSTSDPVYPPSIYPHDPGYRPVVVFLKPAGGGSARIEFTLSTRAEVEAATAIWIAWPDGAVTTATARVITGPVTALRCVSVSGSADWGMLI